MKVVLAGGGRLVFHLARHLNAAGHSVNLIVRSRVDAEEFARDLDLLVIHGDGSDPWIQDQGGVDEADAFVALTPRDPDNIVACLVARRRFEVPRTFALLHDPANNALLRPLGITRALDQTTLLASLLQQEVSTSEVTNLLPLAEGRVNAIEIRVSGRTRWAGHPLRDVPLPEGALVAMVSRNGEHLVPRGDTTLQAGDRAMVICTPTVQGAVVRCLTDQES